MGCSVIMINASLMVRFAQHSTEPHVAWCEPCKQSFAFPLRLPLKCTVFNGNRSLVPGQEALAKSFECVNPADGSFPTAIPDMSFCRRKLIYLEDIIVPMCQSPKIADIFLRVSPRSCSSESQAHSIEVPSWQRPPSTETCSARS